LEDGKLAFFNGILHEDELFTVQALLSAKRAACVKDNLYFYRIRDNSLMTSELSVKRLMGLVTVVTELLNFCAERNLLEKSTSVVEHIQNLSSTAKARFLDLDDEEKRVVADSLVAMLESLGKHAKYFTIEHTPIKVSGKKIAYGVLGIRGKRFLNFLYGTVYEPDELWDIAGDGESVKKPDFERLTKDDLVIVFPRDIEIKTPCPQLRWADINGYVLREKCEAIIKAV
jgi:hypothetical protein